MYFTLSFNGDGDDNYINLNQYSKKSNSEFVNSPPTPIEPFKNLNIHKINKKFNIILDLDNTLLNSVEIDNLNYIPTTIPLKYIDFNISNFNSHFKYRIFARPYLDYFLNEISKFANIAVWTAAGKEYAEEIVNKLFPKNIKIDFLFHSEQTEECLRSFYKMKPLDYLFQLNPSQYNKNNTIIIDNYGMVIDSNKNNSIQIPQFEILYKNLPTFNKDSIHDDELLKILDKIKLRFHLI